MEEALFLTLYNRIQTDPSILILGQNHLALGGERDQLWQRLLEDSFSELSLSFSQTDYPELWRQAVKSTGDAEHVMGQIAAAGARIQKSAALSAIMRMRWSLVYTSAIDSAEDRAVEGFTPVSADEKNAKFQYLNKERHYRVNLCGDQKTPPPNLTDNIEQKKFRNQITTKISWITNAYLEYYGVLVIDGLDPEHDWLNDENLFGQLIDMQAKESIFWFSAPKQLGENAAALVEQGVLLTSPESLYQHILQYMPAAQASAQPEDEQGEEDSDLYASLTLKFNDRQTRTVRISYAAISDITGGDRLCVIDDDILGGNVFGAPGKKNRAQRLADFLTQTGLPLWHLFFEQSGERPFYIERGLDKELEKRVYSALKTAGPRRPVILSGPSNSGKSMMLANLALSIARRRKHPVIFIRGDMDAGAEMRLNEFIENWFGNADRFDGVRPEEVVVIWDGSGLRRSERDYDNLQKQLFTRNTQVIGSVYFSNTPASIQLEQNLSAKELQQLQELLSSLGGDYLNRFKSIKKAQEKSEYFKNSSLLYILQSVFRHEFDVEYRSLEQLLRSQFNQEKIFAERQTSDGIQQYVKQFFETQKQRAADGVAASYQEKLRLLLAQMRDQEMQEGSEEDTRQKELDEYERLRDCIENMNEALALASEFGVALPLRLLLRYLHGVNCFNAEEAAKIIEILRNDTLVDFWLKSHWLYGQDYYISFRNSIEAESYICLRNDLPLGDCSENRMEAEVNILLKIIQSAESDMELLSVLELARQFGPNGKGKLSELKQMQKHIDYTPYRKYWKVIADTIIEAFPDDPEAILVYAHLTREYVASLESEERSALAKDYRNAQTKLDKALDHMENRQSAQYDRLSVELCANYQQGLNEEFNMVNYQAIKRLIRDAFQRSRRKDVGRDFSSNYMLDILLNAYDTYRTASQRTGADTGAELSEIVCRIDEMLNLDELIYEKNPQKILKQVKSVYQQLGEDEEKMVEMEAEFQKRNSDVFLFLQARLIWQEAIELSVSYTANQELRFFSEDRYMVLCKDFPYSGEIPEPLWKQTKRDAERVYDFLAQNMEIIRSTNSMRCMAMFIRAKWFLRAGAPMLAEKQQVALSRTEWRGFAELCNLYMSLRYSSPEEQDVFVPAYFLLGVYEWIYGDPRKAGDWFNDAKDRVRASNQQISVDRLVLCAEAGEGDTAATPVPRMFIVSIQRKESGKYAVAQILREETPASSAQPDLFSRRGMGVSDVVVKYLFEGQIPKETTQTAKKASVIRFNLIGAQMGIPQVGGRDNET